MSSQPPAAGGGGGGPPAAAATIPPPPDNNPLPPRPSLRLNLSAAVKSQQQQAQKESALNAPLQQQQQQQQQPQQPPTASSSSTVISPTKKRKVISYQQPPTKPLPIHTATTSQVTLVHQVTNLHLAYLPTYGGSTHDKQTSQWFAQGSTTLYVLNHNNKASSSSTSGTTSSTTALIQQQLALHLRSSCQVQEIQLFAVSNDDDTTSKPTLIQLPTCQFQHVDPLRHVLVKPASTFEYDPPEQHEKDKDSSSLHHKLNADAQSSRGAAGMTSALRAASIASNLGELRIWYQPPQQQRPTPPTSTTTGGITTTTSTDKSNSTEGGDSTATSTTKVIQQLWTDDLVSHPSLERHRERRQKRIEHIAHQLTEAAQNALKVKVVYRILMDTNNTAPLHLGGLHIVNDPSCPHIYTTCGTLGDHEGPRCWIPCFDTASTCHRHTHQLNIHLASSLLEGLVPIASGDDVGDDSQTYLHWPLVTPTPNNQRDENGNQDVDMVDSENSHTVPVDSTTSSSSNSAPASVGQSSLLTSTTDAELARTVLGHDQVEFLLQMQLQQPPTRSSSDTDASRYPREDHNSDVHVIPNDATTSSHPPSPTLDALQVTATYRTAFWDPIPIRSLGFAVGPFQVLEDAEYFHDNDDDDSDADEEENENDPDRMLMDDEDKNTSAVQSQNSQRLKEARRLGHGIRQYYICPTYQRKFTHLTRANRTLLPPYVELRPLPLTVQQLSQSQQLESTVHVATVGVPWRALSLMRDILAVPTFRTWSHTQVWIPRCHHGGITSGSLHSCPEVSLNACLGLAILDAQWLPPIGSRIPYAFGGRALQCLQARAAIRGWILAAMPLGGNDDVSNGYIHSVTESFLMSLYERGHGAHGEGGAKGGVFYTHRYAAMSGLNSANLDFLPIQNIEDLDPGLGGVGAVPIEERINEQLWRSASNGSESHTSALDEFNIRQLLCRDAVEALERVSEKDKNVPLPSIGWFGSHLSLTYLSSNATSSSDLGCGAVELLHPVGGQVYRALKSEIFRGIVEGRAGVANFVRLIRAVFLAAHLSDMGQCELRLPIRREKKSEGGGNAKAQASSHDVQPLRPPFVVCVNEILKKKGLTHTLFTRALQNLSGPLKEANLLGTLVDVEPNELDPRTRRPLVDPEGFPNSYVRGASLLYCRVGVQVEFGDGGTAQSQSSVAKGISMQAYAEPIIPEGGIAYGGPITMRVVENEGQFREYVKDLIADGSRRDWGSTFLHAKPVSTLKAQTAASGSIESSAKDGSKGLGQDMGAYYPSLQTTCETRAFNENNFHRGGYQAIELIRLTNTTPLLWVRVDPLGQFSGRVSVFQPDACLAECLFHDGDAGAQVEVIRALAERPLRIQATTKVTAIYDVNVSELPVRVLADCLRGSPALHSSLPHTPAVRCQAALAIAQWQNNKAPPTKDAVGLDNWTGANLLIQYFRERFFSNGVVMPVKFSRIALKKSDVEVAEAAAAAGESGAANPKHDENYEYLDSLEEGEERAEKAAAASSIEMEEDEEYRVRSAVVTAISSIRAKDGQTPTFVLTFLETVLEAEDAEIVSHLVYPDEELMLEKAFQHMKSRASGGDDDSSDDDDDVVGMSPQLSFISGKLVADALLALCNVNAWPTMILDPATGKLIQSSAKHPVTRLIKLARSWLDWELYRELIRFEQAAEREGGASGNCQNFIAAAAVLALSNLSILRRSTSDPPTEGSTSADTSDSGAPPPKQDEEATAKFYIKIFDSAPTRNDLTRAACAQAVACICCAADRFQDNAKSVGLLTALEFLLDRLLDDKTPPSLRQTLSLIMFDACSGKVCSTQRVACIGGQNDLIATTSRLLTGPLGASHGGDNGSAILTTVSAASFPAAHAVNEGARRGRRLVGRAGHPKEAVDRATVVRVARFATRLWRTINGDPPEPPKMYQGEPIAGVCAFDGALRCSLLALWQLIWPRGCFSVLQVQDWKSQAHTQQYADLGAHLVMQITEEEKEAAAEEESSLADINRFVELELERQNWRGEMSKKSYEMHKASKGSTALQDVAAAEQGIGQPLPPIQRDAAFKHGGWIASAAQQRRALALDGGTAVTKLRLTVKTHSSDP